jgi:hypothetical protein
MRNLQQAGEFEYFDYTGRHGEGHLGRPWCLPAQEGGLLPQVRALCIQSLHFA